MNIKKTNAYLVFFPVVSIYGMLFLPVSVYALTIGHALLPGMQSPLDHAHELLFGYAMGIAAGYLLNNVPEWWVVSLIICWFAARLSFLLIPASSVAGVVNILFALGFMVTGASRFLPSAKKWRNRAFGVVVVVLALTCIATHFMLAGAPMRIVYMATHEAVLMIALLMLLMAGRMIAPAAAGHIEKQGGSLEARVQPRLEAAIIVLMFLSAIGLLVSPRLGAVAGLSCGVVATVRLIRWRLWACRDRIDLLSLGTGYAWVAVGLIVSGISLLCNFKITVALHAITVGGIGTLTLTVMARTWMQRSGIQPARSRIMAMMTLLIAIAACLRLASGFVPPGSAVPLMFTAAFCWSSAFFLITTGVFLRYPGHAVRK